MPPGAAGGTCPRRQPQLVGEPFPLRGSPSGTSGSRHPPTATRTTTRSTSNRRNQTNAPEVRLSTLPLEQPSASALCSTKRPGSDDARAARTEATPPSNGSP
ncbi:hypothetical protein FHR34_007436 [Kitasatospora kifunensis]|uniref:Uncharacterized protein n=1 Tax=Kitasatospora kifunensis TaxID=58351 RepID=A0A7W7RAH5_KITKI|nr:hypothetical protein [Kitasatospora kifunensis]